MELISITSALMPQGQPALLEMRNYPQIAALAHEHGKKTIRKVLFLIIQNFCNSINVVRNMSEDQIIESAAMMLDECGNFRLEDYQLMFAMAKRGQLVKILDHIDINVISIMMDSYWKIRHAAGKIKESEPPEQKQIENPVPIERVNEFFKQFGEELAQSISQERITELQDRDYRLLENKEKTAKNLLELGLPQEIINQYWK